MALILDHDDVVQLVGFHIGPKLFGTSILAVSEILRNPAIDAVAGAPAFVEGVVRLRGAVAPVVNLGSILGAPGTDDGGDRPWVLMVRAGNRLMGFIVDSVTPIIRIKTDAILPPPDLIMAGMRGKYIRGVCETDRGLLIIADMERLLLDDEIKAMEKMDMN